MSQVLYRKYRSKKLSEIVGQDHITKTLEKALKSGKISHAYLFTGPRGTGKTSIARILAHEINKLEYDESTHLDIIEIDAASNRKIDEIRELRDKVHIAPTSAKYKVYIIDEVHMLTKEAFNALLKTLEEPPEHCIFILATTELHKVPETIQSRTQKYAFKLVEKKAVVDHLAVIAKIEGVKAEREALELIAEHGGGSFRDSISLLDQLASTNDEITADSVDAAIGRVAKDELQSLLQMAEEGKVEGVINALETLEENGAQAPQVAKQLIEIVKTGLRGHAAASSKELELLEDLLSVSASSRPDVKLQIALLKLAASNDPGKNDNSNSALKKTDVKAQAAKVSARAPEAKPAPKEVKKEDKGEIKHAAETEDVPKLPSKAESLTEDSWKKVLDHIRVTSPSLMTGLRMAHPKKDADTLYLYFSHAFHHKKHQDLKIKGAISDAIEKVMGEILVVNAVLDTEIHPLLGMVALPERTEESISLEEMTRLNASTPQMPSDDVKSALDIFGGAEIMANG